MISTLSGACYAVKSIVHISNIYTLKSIYSSHSITKYGIIFGGNSSNSRNIFASQNKVIRINTYEQSRTSGRSLHKQLDVLPIPRQYILSLSTQITKLHYVILSSNTDCY
jgi:hypothetical protein